VNRENLSLGNRVYEELLGSRPRIAFVAEQAYSSGLISHFCEAGYEALVMEWENPAHSHPEWNSERRYLTQTASGLDGEQIAVLWNSTIAFQKFQRYVHRDQDLEEYLAYLESHLGNTPRSLCLYGNDAEIFDFRPGRYATEPAFGSGGEWDRIEHLLGRLHQDDRFALILPRAVLEMGDEAGARTSLHLQTAAHPIPVKKQPKYNVTRWATTGRDDLTINTSCWRIYQGLIRRGVHDEAEWKELCYLWGSDFRTHITERRWLEYLPRLRSAEDRLGSSNSHLAQASSPPSDEKVFVERNDQYLTIETAAVAVRLNCARGLAIESLRFEPGEAEPWVGTLPHGYFEDMRLAADFYTGHLVLETPGQHKLTDLSPLLPKVDRHPGRVEINGVVSTRLGTIGKRVCVSSLEPRIDVEYSLGWSEIPAGSLRIGHVTLNPRAFSLENLLYRTHNGGKEAETFPVGDDSFDHGQAVSFLVSAAQAVGMTENWIELGDHRRCIRIEVDRSAAATVGLVSLRRVGESYLCRLALSLRELDETSRVERSCARPPMRPIRITLTRGGDEARSSSGSDPAI
jgi:hypothetical protein